MSTNGMRQAAVLGDPSYSLGCLFSRKLGEASQAMKTRFGFILARNFTLSPLSLFIDSLRLAGDEGDLSRKREFDWQILGDGLPIRSSCGVELMPTARFGSPQNYDNIVVVGGLLGPQPPLTTNAEMFLLRAAREAKPITGLCTGSFVLARFGLLDGYAACVSWFHIREFRSQFPQVKASADRLYEVDRDRATCSGGAGSADLAAHFISAALGDQAAEKASKILLLDRVRTTRDAQPVSDMFSAAASISVRRALLLMESNLQCPLEIEQIARTAGRSRRQLERLFGLELDTSPKEAYVALRVARAAGLLTSSDMPISDVGYEVGFANAGHFSRVFRQFVGRSPSDLRKSNAHPDRR
jgi:transcriptional regulator GlxA family with amidase domain